MVSFGTCAYADRRDEVAVSNLLVVKVGSKQQLPVFFDRE
jgi:hypothetical protein